MHIVVKQHRRVVAIYGGISSSIRLILSLANRGLGVMLSNPHPTIDSISRVAAVMIFIYLALLLTGLMPHVR